MTPESFWQHENELTDRVRRAAGTMPVFAVRAWAAPVRLGDWQWQDDRLVSAGLVHGDPVGAGPRVEIVTTVYDPRETLASLLHLERWGPGTTGEHGVAVAARAVPVGGLTLDRVVDLAPFTAGREAAIRAARAEA